VKLKQHRIFGIGRPSAGGSDAPDASRTAASVRASTRRRHDTHQLFSASPGKFSHLILRGHHTCPAAVEPVAQFIRRQSVVAGITTTPSFIIAASMSPTAARIAEEQ